MIRAVSGREVRWRSRVGASIGVGFMLACAIGPATAQPPVNIVAAVANASVTGQRWLTDRTVELTIATDAFTAPVPVEVTIPVGYEADRSRRWPVTYYLGGFGHDQSTFRADYDGEDITAAYPSIVVSPRGDSGFWSDWLGGAPPRYESFVTGQLIPLIDAAFRTRPDRAHRAIMGESMGGYGALSLAARHPGEFGAAASLSGAVDSDVPETWSVVGVASLGQGKGFDAVYGPRATQEVRWRGHNPVDLAGNLGETDVQLYTGNGVYDPSHGETQAEGSVGCPLEAALIHAPSVNMHEVLVAQGIPHRWVELPWGCHGVALFETEMRQAIQRFEQVFADPPTDSGSFDFRSMETAFDVRGWSVRADPGRALEFLDLHDVGRNGLTVTGSGTTTITTAPIFQPGNPVQAVVAGNPQDLTPDASGRITLTVDLGPADRQQQFTAGAVTAMTTATVTFG